MVSRYKSRGGDVEGAQHEGRIRQMAQCRIHCAGSGYIERTTAGVEGVRGGVVSEEGWTLHRWGVEDSLGRLICGRTLECGRATVGRRNDGRYAAPDRRPTAVHYYLHCLACAHGDQITGQAARGRVARSGEAQGRARPLTGPPRLAAASPPSPISTLHTHSSLLSSRCCHACSAPITTHRARACRSSPAPRQTQGAILPLNKTTHATARFPAGSQAPCPCRPRPLSLALQADMRQELLSPVHFLRDDQ